VIGRKNTAAVIGRRKITVRTELVEVRARHVVGVPT
jgi:hypothetical protein